MRAESKLHLDKKITTDPIKQRAAAARYRERHPEVAIAYRKSHRRFIQARASEVRRQKRHYVYAVKGQPCTDCGVRYPPFVMDLDHIGSKTNNVSALIDASASWDRIRAEVSQCEPVCSNCHRIRTHVRRGTVVDAA